MEKYASNQDPRGQSFEDPTMHTGNVIVHMGLKAGSHGPSVKSEANYTLASQRPYLLAKMDPISLTASAIAILQLTSELVKATRIYYKGVKNAPQEIAELINESTSFETVLQNLKSISQTAESARRATRAGNGLEGSLGKANSLPMLQEMLKADGPLTTCYQDMMAFKIKLSKDQSSFKKSMGWPFRKEETKAIISRLRNLNAILGIAIASDQL